MASLYLHVNQKSHDDDDDDVAAIKCLQQLHHSADLYFFAGPLGSADTSTGGV